MNKKHLNNLALFPLFKFTMSKPWNKHGELTEV